MENFTYCTPTKLIFGKDAVKKLPKALKPYGTRVLLTYGGGSIKKMGLYDEVKNCWKALKYTNCPALHPTPNIIPVCWKASDFAKNIKLM